MPESLWTARDVAEFIGLHPKTVLNWAKEPDGPPSYRVGKYVRFKPDDVMLWFEAHRRELNGTP